MKDDYQAIEIRVHSNRYGTRFYISDVSNKGGDENMVDRVLSDKAFARMRDTRDGLKEGTELAVESLPDPNADSYGRAHAC